MQPASSGRSGYDRSLDQAARGDEPPAQRPAAAFVPWSALSEEGAAALDPSVRPLVAALNRTGWARTVFSCAGHPEEPDSAARGRRQAHVDVLVSDLRRWHAFVRRCKPAAVEAMRALGLPRGRLRVAEGPLGRLPPWLREASASLPAPKPPPLWRRLLDEADQSGWYYRRLVLEPVPYALEPAACRRLLDAALGASVAAL